MKTMQMLTMVAVCATAMTGWARTVSVASIGANADVTLAFGEPNGTNYTLCVAYGSTNGGDDKYNWDSFEQIGPIADNQTTYTFSMPSYKFSNKYYRFYLLETENLPYARELKYIASNRTSGQFIDTEIEGKLGITMECNIVWLEGADSIFLGARNGTNGRFHVGYVHSAGTGYISFGFGLGDYWNYFDSAAKWQTASHTPFHVVSAMKNNLRQVVVNGTQMCSFNTSNSSATTGRSMYVFCNHDGSSASSGGKMQLFDMKIWRDDGNGDVLVRNYRPVYVDGDGALYDEVSGRVFKNGSSYKFDVGEFEEPKQGRSGVVRAMSEVNAFLPPEVLMIPVVSYWVGGDGDLANAANWCSTNVIGVGVQAAPVSTTEVHFSGTVNASWASASDTLGAAKIVCEDVHLSANSDWRALGSAPFEGHLDLNGWKLQLAGLTGTGAITDRPLAAAGYEALDYIESTGSNYINTGVTGAPGATVEADMMGVQSMRYDLCVVGSRKGGMRFLPFWAVFDSVCFGYNAFKGGDNYGHHANDGFVQNKRYVGYNRMRDGSQNTYMNGLHAHHGDIAGEYDTGLNMYIFGMNWDDKFDYGSRMRLYAARFWTDGGAQLVRDFVPVKQTSDGAIGLYDKVEGTFYAKQGTGSFKAGPTIAAASGPAGELWVEVAKGVTNVNTGVVIGGSAKLVKSGKGAYRTEVLNQTYTGGTRVADGTFDQGVTSANDSMPLGQNEVTVVFEKEADVEWEDGCYFSWETRPANTTFILPSAMQAKGFIMTEELDGVYIKNPKLFIFIR